MIVAQHVYTGHLKLKLMWKNEFAGFSVECLDCSYRPALEVPWGQGILQQTPPVSPCPETTLGLMGTSGPEHSSAPPAAGVAGRGVILQQMLFRPCPAQLSLQVPSDKLEGSLDGSTFRFGCSILLKLLEKKARK